MNKLKSRKLWAALAASLLIVLNDQMQLGLSSETIYAIAAAAGAYMLGQGIADAKDPERKDTEYKRKDTD